MAKYSSIIKICSAILFTLIVSGCTKPDKEEIKDQYITGLVNKINSDSLVSYVTWMQNMSTRFMLADNHRQVAVDIKNKFIRLGYPDTKLDSFNVTVTFNGLEYTTTQYNVIATLTGNTYPDSICVLGAHYDNRISSASGDPFVFVPGANDNATGVGATLEIARVMKKRSFIPSSTIKFVAFGAEEFGLFGSYDFSQKASVRGENISMMLNNDMIGIPSSSDPAMWYVNIIDYDNSHYLRSEAQRLCDRYSSVGYVNDNSSSKRSDSYPFYLNGFPALFFIQNTPGSTYHTESDLVTTINFQYYREIVKISCALLVDRNYVE
jgi:Zn-dependent M28 family amino/carboxypeptidase